MQPSVKKTGSSTGGAGNVAEESTSDGRYSIITDYQYDSNNTSDQTFGKQALEGMEPSEEGLSLIHI